LKKALLTFLIFTFVTMPAISAESVENVYNQLETMDEAFFESSFVPAPKVKVENKGDQEEQEIARERFTKHMPLFKKTRLKVQKFLKVRYDKSEQKMIERELQQAKEDYEKQKQEVEDLDIKYLEYGDETEKAEFEVADKKKDSIVIETELTGGVKEQVTENQMVLDCNNIKVDEATGEIEAVGNPVLIFPAQKVKLTSDKMLYNKDSNVLKAIGNVVLTKDGTPVYGDFIQVNLNEENIFMDNIHAEAPSMKLRAQKVDSENGKLILTKGSMYTDKTHKFNFVSRMIGPDFRKMIIDEEDKNLLLTDSDSSWKIAAAEIGIDASSGHDIFSVRDAEVYHNDKHIFTIPSFKAYTNKDREYFEANYPEFGSISRFGMFAGPGFVYRAPFGSTLKFIPLVNYKNELGVGAAFKFKSSFNDTHLMYGSGADIFRLKGKHHLDEHLHLQYGSNAYMDDWFLGRRMPKYVAELIYENGTKINDFLTEGRDLKFKHRASAAYAQDGEWNMHSERIKSSDTGTTRFRYMAEVDQSLFKIKDEARRRALELSFIMQGSAAIYGTGDTQFVGRMGPKVHTQYKYWMQDLTYFVSGYSDHTPMPVYDMYRYGHSNLRIREALRLNKYLTVGWAGSITLTDDSPNGKLFQENMFMFSIGPDDFKVNLGYDIMRKMTYFIVSVMLDAKNTSVEFDKMEIKNAERLGQSPHNDNADSVAFKETKATVKKHQYAEVVDIEDPDKESI